MIVSKDDQKLINTIMYHLIYSSAPCTWHKSRDDFWQNAAIQDDLHEHLEHFKSDQLMVVVTKIDIADDVDEDG